jgi:molybdopterin molybdotransferase
MHTAEEAWALLAPHLAPLPGENVARADALGRVLLSSPRATTDVPPTDIAAMDGYALAGELPLAVPLRVETTVAAGHAPGASLSPGTIARIMTGAPVPAGADRVLPVEQTSGGDASVTLRHAAKPGDHIRRQGEIQRAGDALLAPGRALTPAGLALLATQGVGRVAVHREPRVAVLVTGDELVAPDALPGPGQIRDSHSDFLLAAGRGLGLRFAALGIAPDDPASLTAAIQRGLAFDVLLISGGVSMGAFDFVEGALAELGVEALFDGVAIQPGKPLVAARHSGGLVFGLPGNPASAMVCFWLFVRPALRRLLGFADGTWQGAVAATLAGPLPASPAARDRFLPAALWSEGGRLFARPFAPRGSHDVATFAEGNALLRLRPGSPACAAGEPCEALLLGAELAPL